MKILFIGGTGNISRACTAHAAAAGYDVWVLNRGTRDVPLPSAAHSIIGDITRAETHAELAKHSFDVVVDWIAYTPEEIERDIRLFRGRTGQYVFISSASCYERAPRHYIITEDTPLRNPYWTYSQKKIACEELLMRAYRDEHFPVTILRPSLTYGDGWIPAALGGTDYTIIDRLRTGRDIIIHGDGTSLWEMTHNTDFASGFTGLLGNAKAVGEAFHITSGEVLTWNDIYRMIAEAAGTALSAVHIPSDFIASVDAEFGARLHGDKAVSIVFDNAKIKRFVPSYRAQVKFCDGIQKAVSWFDADATRCVVNEKMNARIDAVLDAYGA
ncbi:MAG: SDR family oxidoreductase [Spirochaetota bacterium]